VRFKDGFDPEEVDDYLDEIVVEWRKTIEENNDLKSKLAALEAGQSAPSTGQAPVVEASVVEAPAPVATSATGTSAGIIELAQRLSDEHVAEGEAKREQLIAEAEAEVARIRTAAEAKEREESARLERERNTLESRITELREFERDYRGKLRAMIEG